MLDVFHLSTNTFNQRFRQVGGLKRFSLDFDAEDPFVEMRKITKLAAERDQSIFDYYSQKTVPLSFISNLMGKNIFDLLSALPIAEHSHGHCRQ